MWYYEILFHIEKVFTANHAHVTKFCRNLIKKLVGRVCFVSQRYYKYVYGSEGK